MKNFYLLLGTTLLTVWISLIDADVDPGNTFSNCVPHPAKPRSKCPKSLRSYRRFDGVCNNIHHPLLGSTNTALHRLLPANYVDGLDTPLGFPHTKPHVPTANQVSQAAFQVERRKKGNSRQMSTLFMTTGQFLDHDVGLSEHPSCSITDCRNDATAFRYPCFPIRFVKDGRRCTPFARAKPQCQSGRRSERGQRQQVNTLTSFIDGSQIYGTNIRLAQRLRTRKGGKLRVRRGNLLPEDDEKVDCTTQPYCSLSGDKRADENIALHSMHTLWVREHNRVAGRLAKKHKRWNDEKLFQEARRIVIAEWQHIIYTEWLPNIVNLDKYRGYDKNIDASLINAFAAAAFRFGHSLVPNAFGQLNKNFDESHRSVSLQSSFFNFRTVVNRGIDPTMRGLIGNRSNEVDTKFAFGLARRLFVAPGGNDHMDLLALNIQRGRDHGIPTYGAWRKFCGLKPITDFKKLDMPRNVREAFSEIYNSPGDIDLFAAGMAERHMKRLQVGPTFQCIFWHQFRRLREGDRFFYANKGVFLPRQLKEIRKVTMARILCDNLDLTSVNRKAFLASKKKRVMCDRIKKVNLKIF